MSAGLGTRLKPLTDSVPKCLVEIDGKPLLYIWLDLLEKEGVDEVLINTHYFAEKVEEAVTLRKNRIKVNLFYEKALLGSGGTVLYNEDFVRNEKDFFFIFADNLCNVSLKKIRDYHVEMNSLFTTYVYRTDVPKQKGIFVADESGKVLAFEEKPEFPKSNLASAGIGVFSGKVFEIFKSNDKLRVMSEELRVKSGELGVKSGELRVKSEELRVKRNSVIDFGKDVMPLLIDNMYVMETNDYIRDIGTLKDLEEAREEYLRAVRS